MACFPASVIVLCYLFKIAFADQTCSFETTDDVIREDLSLENSTAHSALDCLIRNCGCNARCVVSFNQVTGACMTATLSAAPLAWTKRFLFRSTKDKNWRSFAPKASVVSLPTAVGLWLMDNTFRGRNLGSIGQRLDSSDSGLVWNSEGPLGPRSPLKYAYFNGRAKSKIRNRYNFNYLLSFVKTITIGLWVKTSNRDSKEPLLEGKVLFKKSSDLCLVLSETKDTLYVHGNRIVQTVVNGTDRLQWRHITAVFNGRILTSIYLNANKWSMKSHDDDKMFKVSPDIINFGSKGSLSFMGSMACISFFNVSLTQEEVRSLMHSCP